MESVQVEGRRYRAQHALPVTLYVLATLVGIGGVLSAATLIGGNVAWFMALVIGAFGALLLCVVAALVRAAQDTRYLTALMAQRMLEGVTPADSPSAQTPPERQR